MKFCSEFRDNLKKMKPIACQVLQRCPEISDTEKLFISEFTVNSLFHSPHRPLGLAIRPALLEALRDEAQAVRHAAARVRAHGSRGGARFHTVRPSGLG